MKDPDSDVMKCIADMAKARGYHPIPVAVGWFLAKGYGENRAKALATEVKMRIDAADIANKSSAGEKP